MFLFFGMSHVLAVGNSNVRISVTRHFKDYLSRSAAISSEKYRLVSVGEKVCLMHFNLLPDWCCSVQNKMLSSFVETTAIFSSASVAVPLILQNMFGQSVRISLSI
jgi:hypothetical protein